MSVNGPPEPSRQRRTLVREVTRTLTAVYAASQGVQHSFAKEHALSDTDFRALTAIYVAENQGRPLTGAGLGKELSLSPAAVSYLVDRLVASGHATRDRDPSDRRRLVLRYSEHGRQVAGNFFGPLGARTQAALASFDDEELATALDVIDAMIGAIRGKAEPPASGEDPYPC